MATKLTDAYDLLATSVLLVDDDGRLLHINSAAQDLLERSLKSLEKSAAADLFTDAEAFNKALDYVSGRKLSTVRLTLALRKALENVPANVTLTRLEAMPWRILIEIREFEQHALAERNERLFHEIEIYKDTFRNLAHEVKNPLGGLRGAAQLLEMELQDPALKEYTQVIIDEADRLQGLVDRLIRPSQSQLSLSVINIHEVCERVHALIKAEYQDRITIVKDYDASVPDMKADMAKLVQAYLNLARNAAQSLLGEAPSRSLSASGREVADDNGFDLRAGDSLAHVGPLLTLRTRILNKFYLLNKVHRLVVVVSVVDNGAGVPKQLKDRIFHPLVTGRAEGTGLGLSLAQELVHQHGGLIEFDSEPGHTEFRMLLPLEQV
ncbi:nitrogen regulation protein NR(II) [Advenella kashmirensis WT001]|uniref:histidine kinase n=1 Tax=Advenella kashmirensis (strain DSM 17095 / LMG 22695 / WT001) TaxID=1036672 RepID=I3UBU2_ADVKW|nr:ATP-binding protein [Advenella kashmirensis]AFK62480.1 nitrogen regulation protein NR(II) [Advenella kashmirensis WT001]